MKLESIVQFFAVSVKLFASKAQGRIDNRLLRGCLAPMLELLCRTYSDAQMSQSLRDLSTELIDELSSNLEKSYFVTTFNSVQQ